MMHIQTSGIELEHVYMLIFVVLSPALDAATRSSTEGCEREPVTKLYCLRARMCQVLATVQCVCVCVWNHSVHLHRKEVCRPGESHSQAIDFLCISSVTVDVWMGLG